MLTGAMGQMFINMIQKYIDNLPPEEREKASQTIRFVATLDERMQRMETDIAAIKHLLMITLNEGDDNGSAEDTRRGSDFRAIRDAHQPD